MENISLIVTNATYGIAFILTVVFGFAVYLKSSRKLAHIIFLLMCTSIAVFQISHVLGINTIDPEASRQIFMFNLANIFTVCFMAHWLLLATEKAGKRKLAISLIYAVGAGMLAYFIWNPSDFLLASRAKLYLPNYYEAGRYYFVMALFFMAVSVYSLLELIHAYRKTNVLSRTRIKYFLWAMGIGVTFGPTAFLLVMNIPVDPIYSVIFSLFIVPLAYGMLKYDLMDIRVVAKRALVYAIYVTGIGLLISGINLGNTWLLVLYPDFPDWIIPLTSGVIAVLVGGIIWEKMRELDVLKYEFVTIVTHKFRTPLTRIKWAVEMLKDIDAEKKAVNPIYEIERANEFLVELTDTLAGLGKTDESEYAYDYSHADLASLIRNVISDSDRRIKEKGITVTVTCTYASIPIEADIRRIRFVLLTIIENAISYTPAGGSIAVRAYKSNNSAVVEIQDTGMGIAKDDLSRMFMKFFRSTQAKMVDTEGVGIGLYISKHVVERHGGTIGVRSEGVGKGSVFTLKLPLGNPGAEHKKSSLNLVARA